MAGTKKYEEEMPVYADSEETIAAGQKVGELEGKIPTDGYKGTYTEQIGKMISSYLGRDKFNFNPNNDATYQQIRDTYLAGGKKAMQDTLGSGAMLSGGNNNSAAQVAAQQVYNDYAKRVTDAIPTLEAQAYSRHRTELGDQLQDISLLQGLDEQEYSRHQNEVANIMSLLNYYDNKQQNLIAKDQADYSSKFNAYTYADSANRSDAATLRENGWKKLSMATVPSAEELAAMNMTPAEAKAMITYIKSQSVSSGGGSGNKNSGNDYVYSEGKYDNVTYTDSQLKEMQKRGKYFELFDYLSEKSTSRSNLVSLGKKYGLSEAAIEYYENGKKFTNQTHVDELLATYGKNVPDGAKGTNAMSEEEFYHYGNYNSAYDTYADYLYAIFGKYIKL